jgi:hypothetical protein
MMERLGILCGVLAVVSFYTALLLRTRRKAREDGFKSGYQQGLADARAWSDVENWWSREDREVTRTQKQMQDEERWP